MYLQDSYSKSLMKNTLSEFFKKQQAFNREIFVLAAQYE